jgi:hypothetical protein
MALLDPYASLPDLKARLGGVTTTTDDAVMTEALLAASRSVENATHRQFNIDAGITSRAYYPTSARTSIIDDIANTTGLVVKTDHDDDGVFEVTWAATDYLLRPMNGIVNGVTGWAYNRLDAVGGRYFPQPGRFTYTGPIWREYLNANWPLIHRRPGLQITATFGWPSVPSNVKQACLILAEEIFKMKDAPFGVAGFSNYGVVRVRENPKVAELLADYSLGQMTFA